jgi:hypothetical protein
VHKEFKGAVLECDEFPLGSWHFRRRVFGPADWKVSILVRCHFYSAIIFCPGVTVQLRVACIKNIQGEETPRALFLEGRQVTVMEVLDRWLAFDHRYFKIQGDDDGVYILRHNLATDLWEVTFFEQRWNLAGI